MTAAIHSAKSAEAVSQRPYPAYKPSGVEWLGNVPAHWAARPGRACYASEQVLNSGLLETTVLSLSYGQIKIRPEEKLHGLVPVSFETYQIVEPGDIVCRPTDLQNDWNSLRFGLSPHRGIITAAYMCLRTRPGLTRNYGYLLLHAYDLKKVFYGLGSGLRQNLSWTDFRQLPCLVPPLDEQRAIVRYLDHVDARIRRYVAAKEKLIALLEEERQAVIHRAVTRGLDPNVPLKPSGLEWLGDVPEHWEILRVGRFSKVGNGSTPSRANAAYWTDGVHPWLNSSSVNQGIITRADQFVTNLALRECHLPRLCPGSVLVGITGQGKTRGMVAVLDIDATINQHMAFITPRTTRVSSHYLQMCLTAAYSELRAISSDSGSTKAALTCEDIKRFMVVLPPRDEQERLLSEVRRELANVDDAIGRARRQIELLREYRTRLIADVVTGELDVREAAAQLGEQADEENLIEQGIPMADNTDDSLYNSDESAGELAMEREVAP